MRKRTFLGIIIGLTIYIVIYMNPFLPRREVKITNSIYLLSETSINNVKKSTLVEKVLTTAAGTLKTCPATSPRLVGAIYVEQTMPTSEELKAHSVEFGGGVEKGGWWQPSTCSPRRKVAIIIPYRKREKQLRMFLHNMHPMLQRQLLFYRIIVVEQLKDSPFNRAGLFNIGFVEALKISPFDCFIFTDVDLLPENDKNYYGCPSSPRHMSVAVDKFDYRLPYKTIFGGVGAFTKDHFEKINGMSNLFFGWGGEDDDLYNRIKTKDLLLTRPSLQVGRYTMIKLNHFVASKGNPDRWSLAHSSGERMETDGLNSLKYTLKEVLEEPLATFIKVELNKEDYLNELFDV